MQEVSDNTEMKTNLTVSVQPLTRITDARAKWYSVQEHSKGSFFQSWAWIGAWLEGLPSDDERLLLEIKVQSILIAIGVLNLRKIIRHRFFRSNCLYLNETGIPELDALTIEHNGLLVSEYSDKKLCIIKMISFILREIKNWDEIIVSGVNEENVSDYIMAADENNIYVRILDKKPYYYVDLNDIRLRGQNYIGCLSSNTRQQIRRSIKAYGGHDAISIYQAQSADEGIFFYEKMKMLHQPYWLARGHTGAFSDNVRNEFHQRLIIAGVPEGSVQLLKISTDKGCIGYLYNFVRDGIVSNYQGGFVYQDKPVFRPGLVSHYMAIEHNLNNGMNIYDFLAGEHRYKKSLSTIEGEMFWIALQKRRVMFRIEGSLQKLSRLLRFRTNT